MAHIEGSEKNDRLKGGVADDEIWGFGGKDNISGGAGVDLVYGGSGNDKISGDAGDDVLFGDEGADQINGGDGLDTLIGGDGDDVLDGGAGDDTLIGSGNTFSHDHDVLRGGRGDDAIWGTVNTLAYGGAGFDRLYLDYSYVDHGLTIDFRPLYATGSLTIETATFHEVETVSIFFGTAYADYFTIGDNPAVNWSSSWYLADGDDVALGGASDDALYGGEGRDVLFGADGNDSLGGDGGDDTLFGQNGADLLIGGAGGDWLDGGDGADILMGDLGDDFLTGGGGADQFQFDQGDLGQGVDLVLDFNAAEGDLITISPIDAIDGGDDDAFQFIGEAMFSGTTGELRYEHVGAMTWIYGDTSGDGAADFAVALDGLHTLDSGVFIL